MWQLFRLIFKKIVMLFSKEKIQKEVLLLKVIEIWTK